MPIYEYRREDGTTFEVIQKFSDDPLTKDPDTGKPVQRVYTAPAIHFKGSGFHNTDYGSSRRPRAGSEVVSESKSDSGSSDSAGSSDTAVKKPASDAGSGSSGSDSSGADNKKPQKAKSDSKPAGAAS